jgi:outer membrane protein assembly factor BamB
MCGSPLVVDDLVIVNPGAQTESAIGKAVRAYHRLTGEIVWETGSFNAGYSSPMLAELGGVSQVLIFDGKGLGGYLPKTGQELWRYEWVTQSDQGINVAQPVLLGQDRVLIASGYSRGAALLKVNRQQDQWSVETIWRTNIKTMRAKFSSPVAVGDYLYGLNDGIFECLDLRNGVAVWQDKRRAGRGRAYGHGQMLLVTDQSRPADDPARQQILMVTEANEILLIDPTPQGLREHARLVALSGEKTWNNPAIARGKLLVRNAYEIACYDLTRSE